jgi:hypothetical protein
MKHTNRLILKVYCLLALALLLAGSAAAQTVGGTILGRMADPSGAVIPNGQVVIKNQATGVIREVPTNGAGLYQAPSLAPGTYDVSATAQGFETLVVSNVLLNVGAEVTVNLNLKVGAVGQEVKVEGSTANIELATSEMSQVVGTKSITDLPLNGRDWTQLAQLQPGIAFVRTQNGTDTNRAQRGNGVDLTISGGRPNENNYRLNGISINDYANTAPGSALGTNLGVDAIQEFSVQSSTLAAEYGKVSGGVVNAITRSGTNSLHGSAYYFIRNSALDARNFFDSNRTSALPFRRNQYGGSAGGPFKKNKTFWFVDFEGLRESLATTAIATVPSASIRGTAVPSIQPYLAIYPLPNGTLSANGQTGQFIFPSTRVSHDDFVTGKIDHRFSDKDSINGTYLFDNGKYNAPDEMDNKLVGATSRRNNITFEESHSFSPSVFNSFRLGFARTHATNNSVQQDLNSALSNQALAFIPGHEVGGLSISGITTFGGGVHGPDENNFHYNSYQVYNDLYVIRGIHSFKFGGVFERMQDNFFAGFTTNGLFSFGSLTNFLANIPTSFSGLLPTSDNTRGIRQSLAGVYGQDTIRLRSNLTINVGLRYEIVTVPSEVNGKIANLKNITDAQATVGFLFNNPTLKDFSPRVGFAWDPFNNGKTSIRGGFGLFDNLPLAYAFTNRFPRTPPFFEQGIISYTAGKSPANFFPTSGFSLIGPATFRAIYVQPNPPRPFKTQYNLNIQRELIKDMVLTVGFVGARGYNLVNGYDETNLAPPTTTDPFTWSAATPKINPNFGRIAFTGWNADSWYDAMQVNLRKSFSHGLMAQVAYTWAKSIDTGSNAFSTNEFANTVDDPAGIFAPGLNKGLSDYDIRHNIVVNFLYNIPTPGSWNGLSKGVLGGWQMASIFSASTGSPMTVLLNNDRAGTKSSQTSNLLGQRPNYVAGCNTSNPGQVNYINTSCFTFPAAFTLGDLGRNSITGPGLQDLDFSLFKTTNVPKISENFRVQFRAEFFNILNHTNFAQPDVAHFTIFDVNGNINSNAGQITGTQTPSRQIQFGLKFLW